MQMRVARMLEDQVRELGSKQAVASKMGVSRTAVSLYLTGRLEANGGRIDRFEARAIECFCDRVLCPHLHQDIAQEDCAAFRERPCPTSDPEALRLWTACRHCPMNPANASQEATCSVKC